MIVSLSVDSAEGVARTGRSRDPGRNLGTPPSALVRLLIRSRFPRGGLLTRVVADSDGRGERGNRDGKVCECVLEEF
jgi:hypothetical protein